ncbi:hypothetical protein U1Q18_030687, partial [Sarracenia purpurea var. burkii]
MSEAKWEDLNVDYLVNIFGRLEMEYLVFDVPFVCKSWHKATHNPQCWRHLDFFEILPNYLFDDISFSSRFLNIYGVIDPDSAFGFMKSIVQRVSYLLLTNPIHLRQHGYVGGAGLVNTL